MTTPYRQNARPRGEAVSRRRSGVWYLVSGSLLGLALLGAWWKVPETLHVELRVVKEAMPPHEPLTSAWSNETGTRVLAVGAHGQVSN